MKTENVILEKTYHFGLRIIKLFSHLKKNKVERDIALQILRSGTSIGANTEEAIGGSSRKDFINKLKVSYKEARETRYWIRLLKDSSMMDQKLAESFLAECEELIKILTAILNTSKAKQIINS